jgi:hypothetical protein
MGGEKHFYCAGQNYTTASANSYYGLSKFSNLFFGLGSERASTASTTDNGGGKLGGGAEVDDKDVLDELDEIVSSSQLIRLSSSSIWFLFCAITSL